MQSSKIKYGLIKVNDKAEFLEGKDEISEWIGTWNGTSARLLI